MRSLELKVPPPLVALVVAGGMWALARVSYRFALFTTHRQAVAGALFVLGVLCAVSAVLAFRRSKTTVNPTRPEASTALVRSGPFRISRNPMYLGLLLALLGWAVLLAAPWSLIGPVIFVLYIQRFQILPEERVMTAKFGAEFERYRSTVRRWL
jgi:protein-S-isoprenylcysteine O-methyltransferase Ste14